MPTDAVTASRSWLVSDEERAIEVTINTVDTPLDPAVLVHQTAGFDHVKHAYTVLASTGGGLRTLRSWVEGPGPDRLNVQPDQQGLVVKSAR